MAQEAIPLEPRTDGFRLEGGDLDGGLQLDNPGKLGICIYKYEKPVFLKIGKRAFLCLLGFPQTPNVASAQLRDFFKIASGGKENRIEFVIPNR